MMKRLLTTILCLLIICSYASAFDLSRYSALDYITVPYLSVDAENNPVMLSELVAYPTESSSDKTPRKVKFVVLNNHGTIMKDSQAPTGSEPLDAVTQLNLAPRGAMNLMTTEDALVISPDYLGYGYSRDYVHPYCSHTLTARNVVDGFLAAIDTVRARGIEIADEYYTYNIGYSQGGSVAMAVQKYLETEASQEVNDAFRLKKSICGAGPYNLEFIFEDLCKQDSLSYPCSLPLTFESLCTTFHEGCMKTIDPDSVYITPEFKVAVRDSMLNKNLTTDEICQWMKDYFGKSSLSMQDIFKVETFQNNGPTIRSLQKALHKCNMLDGSWIPEKEMILFHYTKDEIVQFGNSEQAVELFGDKVTLYTEQDNLTSKISDVIILSIINALMSNPQCHSDYGILFYAYFITGLLR